MAKKIVKMKEHEGCAPEAFTFNFRHMIMFLFMAFLAALGFAALIHGLFMQFQFGYKWGIFAYLLAFIFMGMAKHIKWKLFSPMHSCSCK